MFKAGDKVTTVSKHLTGVVLYTPTPDGKVRVRWEDPDVVCTEQVARLRLLEEEKPEAGGFLYKEGDRVRLKWNKNAGTIIEDQRGDSVSVAVHWDHSDKELWEFTSGLIALHTPRDPEGPHPMQAALDNIEEERTKLKKQIEDLQFKLSGLTKAKKMLKEGY